MKKFLKDKVNQTLEDVSYDLTGSRGCNWFWGEIEVPECLRRELENDEEDEK